MIDWLLILVLPLLNLFFFQTLLTDWMLENLVGESESVMKSVTVTKYNFERRYSSGARLVVLSETECCTIDLAV